MAGFQLLTRGKIRARLIQIELKDCAVAIVAAKPFAIQNVRRIQQ
jgi:hypothetical protein